jgi:hypothetical protein
VRISRTALQRLALRAQERGDSTAVRHREDGRWASLTWNELHRRVESGAAGLAELGLRRGQVALVMLPSGLVTLEMQHAIRSLGAVPVLVAPELSPAELSEALAGVRVGMVAVSHEYEHICIEAVDISEAIVLDMDAAGAKWEEIRTTGAAALALKSTLVELLDLANDRHSERPLVVAPGLLSPHVLRVEAAVSSMTVDDVVLLVGLPSDEHVQSALETHLIAGAELAWPGDVATLGEDIAAISPTFIQLDARSTGELDSVIAGATIDGEPWSDEPQAVLDRVRELAPRQRSARTPLSRIEGLDALAAWFGPALHRFHVVGGPTLLVQNLGEMLGFEAFSLSEPFAVQAEVPRDVAVAPEASALLPKRTRRGRDAAFTPIVEAAVASPEAAESARPSGIASDKGAKPSLSLLGGESMLDRVLAQQGSRDVDSSKQTSPEAAVAADRVGNRRSVRGFHGLGSLPVR